MRETMFSTPVHARLETVWNILLDKAEHPDRFIPGVEQVSISDRFEGGFIRQMKTQGMEITERIIIDAEGGEIRFELLEHPLFSGFIVNRVVPTSRQSPVAPQTLTFQVEWIPKTDEADRSLREEMTSAVQQAVLVVKELAEEMDAESPGVPTLQGRTEDLQL